VSSRLIISLTDRFNRDVTKFFHICILGGSTCFDHGLSVQKATMEIAHGKNSLSGYAYFRQLLASHVENWKPRLPEPIYLSRRFLHASPRPRQPQEKLPPRPRSRGAPPPPPQSPVKPYKLPVPQSDCQPGIRAERVNVSRIPRPAAQPKEVRRQLKSAFLGILRMREVECSQDSSVSDMMSSITLRCCWIWRG
jgi:hypothetical protein